MSTTFNDTFHPAPSYTLRVPEPAAAVADTADMSWEDFCLLLGAALKPFSGAFLAVGHAVRRCQGLPILYPLDNKPDASPA